MKTGTINGGKDMKKYSWIVALLLALSLSALFISCGVDPIVSEPPEGVTYTEVLLNNGMNVWAGGKDQQQGWATGDGFKFLGVGDKLETAKDLGYKAEDFKAAEFLEFELVAEAPKGGVQIIWGASEGNDKNISCWNSKKLTTDNGVIEAAAGVTERKETTDDGKEKKIWKIELKKALTDYGKYKNADEVKIILQYYTGKGVSDLYVANSGKLLIPNVEVPFKEIKSITLDKDNFLWSGELELKAKFDPEDATQQVVIWSIVDWTSSATGAKPITVTGDPKTPDKSPGKDAFGADIPSYNDSKSTLTAKVDFKPTKYTISDKIIETDYSVVPPIDVLIQDAVTQTWKSNNTIIAPDEIDSKGTVTIQALVLGGGKDGADYTTTLKVTIKDPDGLNITVNGTVQEVFYYNAIGGDITVAADKSGYTYTSEGKQNYGGNYAAFRVDLGSDSLSDYSKVTFKFNGISGDTGFKKLQLAARNGNKISPYTGGLWSDPPAAPWVGKQSAAADDHPELATETEQYHGPTGAEAMVIKVGADGDSTSTANATAFVTNLAAAADNIVWVVIHCHGANDNGVSFTISDIKFVK